MGFACRVQSHILGQKLLGVSQSFLHQFNGGASTSFSSSWSLRGWDYWFWNLVDDSSSLSKRDLLSSCQVVDRSPHRWADHSQAHRVQEGIPVPRFSVDPQ